MRDSTVAASPEPPPAQPPSPGRRGWWTRRSAAATAAILIVALFGLLALITGNRGKEGIHPGVPKVSVSTPVAGTFSQDCGSAGDSDACKALTVSDVKCEWVGTAMRLSATLHNGLNAHVTVHIEPVYKLENAGEHGTGLANFKDVGIAAHGEREWSGSLGEPAGVSGQPRITACAPRLAPTGVDIG